MDAEQIANNARRSIGKFCINECRAYCCRKGYLVMRPEEVVVVLYTKATKYKDLVKELPNGTFSMYMGTCDMGCPSLKEDFKCRIHKNELRPKVCREFPLFIRGKRAVVSERCLAVREGLLYPYLRALQHLGYEISYQDQLDTAQAFNAIEPKVVIATEKVINNK